MKRYLLVRWKKRWPIIPASAIFGTLWIVLSMGRHDGKARSIVAFLIVFDLVVLLFPLRWGQEILDN